MQHGHITVITRLSPRFFPRARTEAGEWRRKPHVKVPSPRTAARQMCAADVPTAFPRSAADWRQGVHSERGKGETRATQVAQTERGVFAQARLATNCTPARASLRDSLSLGGYALGFPPWAGVSPSPWTLPLRGERGKSAALCARLWRGDGEEAG